jgi:hypothetical protein
MGKSKQAKRNSGGSAAQAGINFQNRVAAWVAVRVLCNSAGHPIFGLQGTPTLFRAETEQPVDDLLIGTSAGAFAFVNIKHSLDLSDAADSVFRSVVRQFTKQTLAYRSGQGSRPWEKRLDPARDRLVLVVGAAAPAPIRLYLKNALGKLHRLLPGEPIENAATNAQETRALRVVEALFREAYVQETGETPSTEQVSEAIGLMRIEVLDADPDGDAEREAKTALRSIVLADPNQADVAWHTVINVCSQLAETRSGANRAALQRPLLIAGLLLNVPRSFEPDITKLRRATERNEKALADLGRIRVKDHVVRIDRAVTSEIERIASSESLLVVGEPGAGKSGALVHFAERLRSEGRDFVMLAVDRLSATSEDLLRVELGLEHNLDEVLESWVGNTPAYLIIDALDAARGGSAGQTIRRVIAAVINGNSRWRVAASIRKFDLRYSDELRALFPEGPVKADPAFHDRHFPFVTHVNIRTLSDAELLNIKSQSSDLADLIDRAPDRLQVLLRNPFNLKLLSDLLTDGVDVDQLAPIRTQLDLLDRYWSRRVLSDNERSEAVLRQVIEGMAAAQMLRVDAASVGHPASAAPLNKLKSEQVLVEWQLSADQEPNRYILAFSHHVLFDYAAERLLLRGDPRNLVRRIADQPELVLILHPSFTLHFHHLWNPANNASFWNLAFDLIRSSDIPEIGKLIGPAAASELAESSDDFAPLLAAMRGPDPNRTVADQIFQHLVGSLLVDPRGTRALVGSSAGPWAELLDEVTRDLRPILAYPVSSLLSTACEALDQTTPEQFQHFGAASRKLLDYAWQKFPYDAWLANRAMECVSKSFGSNPSESARILRKAIERQHLVKHGFEEMPWLARQITRLIPFDLQLVEDIYVAVFNFQEASTEKTDMTQSRIFRLSGNKRQDYGMARFELANAFSLFLKREPQRAIRVAVSAMEAYAREEKSVRDDAKIEEFAFGSQTGHILTDYSHIWDGRLSTHNDDSIRMLETLVNHWEALAKSADGMPEFRDHLSSLLACNKAAVFWKRLLELGAKYPASIGEEIAPFAYALPILTNIDTVHPAGEYLAACFSELHAETQEQIERTIVSIPDHVPGPSGELMRAQLLGCISLEKLRTLEAKTLLTRLIDESLVPANKPPIEFHPFSRAYGELDYLEDHGVDVESKANANIRRLEAPVAAFASAHRNTAPSMEQIQEILPCLSDLQLALANAETDGVDPKQAEYATAVLAEAAVGVTHVQQIPCDTPAGQLTRSILYAVRNHPSPLPDPRYDAQFDSGPAWGLSPRILAAGGLTNLARNSSCADRQLLEAVEELSEDLVPSVRFQVAVRLASLYYTDPERMWSIVDRIASADPSTGVISGLLGSTLSQLAGAHLERVAVVVKTILTRGLSGPGSDEVVAGAMLILTGQHVYQNHPLSGELLEQFLAAPAANARFLQRALFNLRGLVTYGASDLPSPNDDAIRGRAIELFSRIVQSAKNALDVLEIAGTGTEFTSWPEERQEEARRLARLLDTAAKEFYFASGAFDEKQHAPQPDKQRLSLDLKKRFFEESRAIVDLLADLGFPGVAHSVVETLESFVTFDPRSVFLDIGRVVRAGQSGGYQFEQMAAALIVKLVERYLAGYRELLQNDNDCRRTLIELLDTFIKAGWPDARRLTHRLQEIFQ